MVSIPPQIAQELRQYISYDPETGICRWIVRPKYTQVKIGDEIGYIGNHGYRVVSYRSYDILLHHLAWFLHYGVWIQEIDHEDHDPLNNRIRNLRESTGSFNKENQIRAHINNDTGFLGVSYNEKYAKPYRARIQVNGIQTEIGRYDTPEEAHAAYLEAKRKLHRGNTL